MERGSLDKGVRRGLNFGSSVFVVGFLWVVLMKADYEIDAGSWTLVALISAMAFVFAFLRGIRSESPSISSHKQNTAKVLGLLLITIGCFNLPPYQPITESSMGSHGINAFLLVSLSLILIYFYLRPRWEKGIETSSVKRWTVKGESDKRYNDYSWFWILMSYIVIIFSVTFLIISSSQLIINDAPWFVFYSFVILAGVILIKKSTRERDKIT